MPAAKNPLSDEHLACLDRVLSSCPQTKELLTKLRDCGLDVAELERENEEHQKLAQKIKSNFFADRP